MTPRKIRGSRSHARGIGAEATVCARLEQDGWRILARRLRTAAGELDVVADKDGLLAIIEVKARASLGLAAASVSVRQQARLMAAAEILLAENPGWGAQGVRFDVFVVDARGAVRRIADAFRLES
jgi:putative endonuclease